MRWLNDPACHRVSVFWKIFMTQSSLGGGSNPAPGEAKQKDAAIQSAEVFALPL
jgi:hypothetical protein